MGNHELHDLVLKQSDLRSLTDTFYKDTEGNYNPNLCGYHIRGKGYDVYNNDRKIDALSLTQTIHEVNDIARDLCMVGPGIN